MDGERDTEVFETIEDHNNRRPENIEVFEENNGGSGSGEEFEEDEDIPLVSGKKKKKSLRLNNI
jgi:adenosyl cobinamide kinase/adenosyl cobinamide phosphate guanylyltransferase